MAGKKKKLRKVDSKAMKKLQADAVCGVILAKVGGASMESGGRYIFNRLKIDLIPGFRGCHGSRMCWRS